MSSERSITHSVPRDSQSLHGGGPPVHLVFRFLQASHAAEIRAALPVGCRLFPALLTLAEDGDDDEFEFEFEFEDEDDEDEDEGDGSPPPLAGLIGRDLAVEGIVSGFNFIRARFNVSYSFLVVIIIIIITVVVVVVVVVVVIILSSSFLLKPRRRRKIRPLNCRCGWEKRQWKSVENGGLVWSVPGSG
jgi:hypothetical protein